CVAQSSGPLAAARIAGEGAQFLSRLGLENVDAHCLSLSDLASGLNAADNRASATPKLIAQGRTGASPRMFVLMTKDQAALLKVVGRHFDGHKIASQSLVTAALCGSGSSMAEPGATSGGPSPEWTCGSASRCREGTPPLRRRTARSRHLLPR